jgi:hypothetical protein
MNLTLSRGTGHRRQSRIPGSLKEFLVLRPMPSRHRSATIAALCTAAPILLGQTLGQPVLGLIASTGALAALYGGRDTPLRETRAVGAAALGLALSMAIGSSFAGHDWLAVASTALWAAVVAAGYALARSRPPGIVMPILVCSVGTGLPPGHTLARTAVVAAVGAVAALLSGLVARFQQNASGSRAGQAVIGEPFARLRLSLMSLRSSPFPWMGMRTGLAVGLAGVASLLCQVGRPYWAMAAAGAILGRGTHAASANTRALLRGTGTAVGCLLAGTLAAAHPRGVTVAVLLGMLTYVIELVVARNYAVAMIFVTPLSIILLTSATGTTAILSVTADRLLETVLGCLAAASAGQLVTRRWAVRHRRQAMAAVLTAGADLLETRQSPLRRAALDNAVAQLRLVSERTAGERPSVRAGVSELDRSAAAVLTEAERIMHWTAMPGASTADGSASEANALRRLATLADPCVIGPARQTSPRSPLPLAELDEALQGLPPVTESTVPGNESGAGRPAASLRAHRSNRN